VVFQDVGNMDVLFILMVDYFEHSHLATHLSPPDFFTPHPYTSYFTIHNKYPSLHIMLS